MKRLRERRQQLIRRTCRAKVRYASFEEAIQYRNDWQLIGIEPYFCRYCQHIHLGHP